MTDTNTDTITIRRMHACLLKPDMRVRCGDETQTVRRVTTGYKHTVVLFEDGSGAVFPTGARVWVVADDDTREPEPEPEAGPEAEAWPTAPVIRVLDGHRRFQGLGGAIALRVGLRAYRLFVDGDETGIILKDEDDEGIDQWEPLSVVPTATVRTLAKRLDELDAAVTGDLVPGCRIVGTALSVAEAARDLVQVADAGETVG